MNDNDGDQMGTSGSSFPPRLAAVPGVTELPESEPTAEAGDARGRDDKGGEAELTSRC
jgi:hypothetical protein